MKRDPRTPTLEQAVAEGWYEQTDGYCLCGCGEKTELARSTSRKKKMLKAHPLRFKYGHGMAGPMNPNYGQVGAMAGRGGEDHPGWKGGRKNLRGYIQVWIPAGHPLAPMRSKAGYVLEHRFVMAEHLGRALVPEEIVHHRNGFKDDNRIENLEIVTRRQHTEHHTDRARLAEQVLKKIESLGLRPETVLEVLDPHIATVLTFFKRDLTNRPL